MNCFSPNVSIIVSCYNQADTVIAGLRSLAAQKPEGCNVEIVIADDGSSPTHVKRILKAMREIEWNGNIFLVWQQDIDFRLAASRNNGIAIARSEILIFIDGDCIPQKGFIKSHMDAHLGVNGVSIVTGHRKFADHSNLLWGKTEDLDITLQRREREEAYDVRTRVQSNSPWSSVLGRNFSCKMTRERRKFDERIVGWGFEDIAFALECYYKDNAEFFYCPNAVVMQVDALIDTHNPFVSKEGFDIARAIVNALLIMSDYQDDTGIFCRLAIFLGHYVEPFNFEFGYFSYDETAADAFFRNVAAGKIYSKPEADEVYMTAMQRLLEYMRYAELSLRERLLGSFMKIGTRSCPTGFDISSVYTCANPVNLQSLSSENENILALKGWQYNDAFLDDPWVMRIMKGSEIGKNTIFVFCNQDIGENELRHRATSLARGRKVLQF